MELWTLIWILIFPPVGTSSEVKWEYHQERDLTFSACVELLAEKDAQYKIDAMDGNIMGHKIYCREPRGNTSE